MAQAIHLSQYLQPTTDISSFCIECEDQPASIICVGCQGEIYCSVCHASLHRKGSRNSHETRVFGNASVETSNVSMSEAPLDEDEDVAGKEGEYVLQDLPKLKGDIGD
jgi:hypothetical protein